MMKDELDVGEEKLKFLDQSKADSRAVLNGVPGQAIANRAWCKKWLSI